MKKILLISTISLMTSSMAGAATPWWEQPTICKINPTQCYSNMTTGYFIETGNTETWDATGNCWGLKVICPNALTNGATEPTPMTRADIAQRKNIIRFDEIEQNKKLLYKGLYQWLLENIDDLKDLHNNSVICGEWLGMGCLKYSIDEFDKKWYMFAKANIDDNFPSIFGIYIT